MTNEGIPYDVFFRQLKTSSPAGIYLFEGEEEHVKRSALTQLTAATQLGAFPDMNQTTLKDPDAAKLMAAAETLPFMAEQRLVIVRDSAMLTGGKARDYDDADSAEQLKNYLPQKSASTVLVFYVRGSADKRKKLYQTLKKTATVVTFDRLDQVQLRKYIAGTLKKAGLAITQDACEQLIYSVGDDLTALLSETEKLIAYCDGQESVTAEDIRAVCAARTEYRVFELAQTVLQGQGQKAFDMLKGLLLDGESPLMLLSLLNRQCRQAYDICLFTQAGLQPAAIAGKLGVPPFAVRQTLPLARAYTPESLAEMIRLCTEVEFDVKAGRLNEEGAMELAMLRILNLKGTAA